VIVDVSISETNAHGRAFWKKSFKKDDEILEVRSSKHHHSHCLSLADTTRHDTTRHDATRHAGGPVEAVREGALPVL
jgi:hypothetical protein